MNSSMFLLKDTDPTMEASSGYTDLAPSLMPATQLEFDPELVLETENNTFPFTIKHPCHLPRITVGYRDYQAEIRALFAQVL